MLISRIYIVNNVYICVYNLIKVMERIEKLETLTTIDEYIKYYKDRIDERQWSNEFGAGLQLQSIRKINDHDIDIFNRCIDRLNDRFRKLAITLK